MFLRKLSIALVAILAIVVMAGVANATPKFIDAIASCDVDGNVTIPPLPAGATLLNVYVYDDVRGVKEKSLGPVHSYKLIRGQGTNFFYKDSEGNWYQMITPLSPKPGGYLVKDCSWIDPATGAPACKWLFPLLEEKK